MNTSAAQQPPASPVSIQSSLDSTERLLKDCTARTRRGNRITIFVGAVALLLLGGYFAYGYSEIASVTKPKTLIDVAENWIEERLPEVRRDLEAEVDKSAPVWAESLSKQAQASLPSIREKLEAYVLDQVDKNMEEAVTLSEEQFRKLLREKRQVLEDGFKDLATSPQLAKESLKEVEDALAGIFETEMKQGATELFATLNLMNEKLGRLKDGKQMTPEETLERLVLMQCRKLQSEQLLATTAAEDAAASQAADKP